jgi:hypothetical protein
MEVYLPPNIIDVLNMKKNNLTKQFYQLLREDDSQIAQLKSYAYKFIDEHSCSEILNYFKQYQKAVEDGQVTISKEDKDELDSGINDLELAQFIACKKAKKELKQNIDTQIAKDPQKVISQMCWFNDNMLHDNTVTFCKNQNQTQQGTNTQTEIGNTQTQQGTNTSTEVSNQTTTDDKNKGTVEQPKVEEKPKPIEASNEVKDSFDRKYPCLSKLPTKTAVNDDGAEFSYKVESFDGDETVYYYLNGTCKIKKLSDGSVQSKYFRC